MMYEGLVTSVDSGRAVHQTLDGAWQGERKILGVVATGPGTKKKMQAGGLGVNVPMPEVNSERFTKPAERNGG